MTMLCCLMPDVVSLNLSEGENSITKRYLGFFSCVWIFVTKFGIHDILSEIFNFPFKIVLIFFCTIVNILDLKRKEFDRNMSQ